MLAMERTPAQIKPWYGPARGFSFNREVQPVLDRLCVTCHKGADPKRPDFTLRPDARAGSASAAYNNEAHFPPAYLALRAYVRGHTMESDMHMLMPCEYHASTTDLVRLLEDGHHGVKLDAEAWDRITTWIDLNTPAHGTWPEIADEARVARWAPRRSDLIKRYAGLDEDLEDRAYRQAWQGKPAHVPDPTVESLVPRPLPSAKISLSSAFAPETKTVDLGEGAALRFVRVPAGSLTTSAGAEQAFAKPFWMGAVEVRNRDYVRFDPTHDSRLERSEFLHFSEEARGFPCNLPDQPVCRVSRDRAQAFCDWLSAKTGLRCRLPTAAEWEWSARAGSDGPAGCGAATNDFSKLANLADQSLRTVLTLGWGLPSDAIPAYRPAATNVNDGFRVSAPVGSFQPNAWGLFDTQGNVWEWTAETVADGRAVARGGSWYCRPEKALFDARAFYPAWQPVYDVGFRIVVEDEKTPIQPL